MRFKLDENLGKRLQALFADAGHDVHTVSQKGLSGSADAEIYAICRREDRVLVSLDTDFGNIVRFPPENTPGLVVIRLPEPASHGVLLALGDSILHALATRDVRGHLWIAEPGRIRERPAWPEGDDEDATA